MNLLINSPAPPFTLQTLQGNLVSLKDVLDDHSFTLLVFLRHLG